MEARGRVVVGERCRPSNVCPGSRGNLRRATYRVHSSAYGELVQTTRSAQNPTADRDSVQSSPHSSSQSHSTAIRSKSNARGSRTPPRRRAAPSPTTGPAGVTAAPRSATRTRPHREPPTPPTSSRDRQQVCLRVGDLQPDPVTRPLHLRPIQRAVRVVVGQAVQATAQRRQMGGQRVVLLGADLCGHPRRIRGVQPPIHQFQHERLHRCRRRRHVQPLAPVDHPARSMVANRIAPPHLPHRSTPDSRCLVPVRVFFRDGSDNRRVTRSWSSADTSAGH